MISTNLSYRKVDAFQEWRWSD